MLQGRRTLSDPVHASGTVLHGVEGSKLGLSKNCSIVLSHSMNACSSPAIPRSPDSGSPCSTQEGLLSSRNLRPENIEAHQLNSHLSIGVPPWLASSALSVIQAFPVGILDTNCSKAAWCEV
jgi:hypothetical protein